MVIKEPLSNTEAKKLMVTIINTGSIVFGVHFLKAIEDDKMIIPDALNVIKGGVVEAAEMEQGTWRYRVKTSRMFVVVAFWSETKISLVTAWRLKGKR